MEEGNEMDYKHSFDLSGTHNDEMLSLYLRKAGLSDKLECYPAVQRRAYIVDIIKSKKMPGNWVPPIMEGHITPPSVRPPPLSQRTPTSTPLSERKFPSNHATRFVPAPHNPPPPMKGNRREISSPTNFQHLSGDLTRDMTRKAFDLAPDGNDNVLRKYMIERGINEADVAEYSKDTLIRKIVQSKFTWMPPKKNDMELNLKYATISTYEETSQPPSPQPSISSKLWEFEDYDYVPPVRQTVEYSNFSLVTSRFADPSLFPTPEQLYENVNKSNPASQQRQSRRLKPQAPPPPPPAVKMTKPANIRKKPVEEDLYEVVTVHAQLPRADAKKYSTFGKSSTLPPQPPPLATLPRNQNRIDMLSRTLPTKKFTRLSIDDITFEPPTTNKSKIVTKSNVNETNNFIPPQPQQQGIEKNNFIQKPKQQQQGREMNNFIPPPPPPQQQQHQAIEKNHFVPPPPPPPQQQQGIEMNNFIPKPKLQQQGRGNNNFIPPPPPTQQQQAIEKNNFVPLPPPPPPLLNENLGTLPPPPPPAPNNTKEHKPPNNNLGGDPRDAFLQSIRQGVNLKKVNNATSKNGTLRESNQKSVKSKPKANDLFSELKMTLQRVRQHDNDNLSDNEFNESNA